MNTAALTPGTNAYRQAMRINAAERAGTPIREVAANIGRATWPVLPPADPEWLNRAACRGSDTRVFYPERGEASKVAMAICAGCPVRAECLAYALAVGERLGIWGGVSERGRRRRRRAAREAPVA